MHKLKLYHYFFQLGFNNTSKEISDTKTWMEAKVEELKTNKYASIDTRMSELKVLVKEIDNKSMVIETLETKVETISSDLESSEYSELKKKLEELYEVHTKLSRHAANSLKVLSESAEFHKKYEADLSEAENWLKSKISEFQKATEFEPLKAYDIERKIAKLKKDLHEISDYEESSVSSLKLCILNIEKNGDESMKKQASEDNKNIDLLVNQLKDGVKNR